MCRYSGKRYKTHWACFACRVCFKRPSGADSLPCPNCAEAAVDMGKDFKRPRRSDDKGWRKVEALSRAGFTFHSCGCSGPGHRPKTLAGLREFLDGKKDEQASTYVGKLLAKRRGASGAGRGR